MYAICLKSADGQVLGFKPAADTVLWPNADQPELIQAFGTEAEAQTVLDRYSAERRGCLHVVPHPGAPATPLTPAAPPRPTPIRLAPAKE